MFKKAVKTESKLRMALAGPSGSGKTWTALTFAQALGQRIAVVDTEHGSASKYADMFTFDVVEPASYSPQVFVEAINEAVAGGYDVIVLDSLSHAWMGTGGLLEIVDNIAKRSNSGNSYTAWKDATPLQNKLVDTIIAAPIHVIATMRSKQGYVLETNDRGKQVPKKVGMEPVQRDGVEYEFDVFCEMDVDNNLIVTKTRCPALTGKVFAKPTGAVVTEVIAPWLTGEKAPVKASAPEPQNEPQNEPFVIPDWFVASDKSLEAARGVKVEVGKYAGKTLGEIDDSDHSYIAWITGPKFEPKNKAQENIKRAATYLLAYRRSKFDALVLPEEEAA